MDGTAVPGPHEAAAIDLNDLDADALEPLGGLGGSGGHQYLPGLKYDSRLGSPLKEDGALVPGADDPAYVVGGDDEFPVHLGLHPVHEVLV